MPFNKLFFLRPPDPVDALTTLHGRALLNLGSPAHHVFVRRHIEKLLRIVDAADNQAAIPGVIGHVRDIVTVGEGRDEKTFFYDLDKNGYEEYMHREKEFDIDINLMFCRCSFWFEFGIWVNPVPRKSMILEEIRVGENPYVEG